MNLYQLRYFVTLAKEEHYTKAAAKLHITQPSLTHAIHLMEDELGLNLFERKGRNVVLTKYGNLFLKEIEPILLHLDDSIDAMKEIATTVGMTAVEYTGTRYDMGNKLGILQASIEVGINHPEVGEDFKKYLKEFAKTL